MDRDQYKRINSDVERYQREWDRMIELYKENPYSPEIPDSIRDRIRLAAISSS